MSRLTFSAFGVLLLVTTLSGCTQAPQPVLAGSSNPSNLESQPYKLRLVFDGLVALKEPDSSDKNAWVLVGNASHPDQLAVGKKIPPHMSYLLVRVKDDNGEEEAEVSGRPFDSSEHMNSMKRMLGLPGSWVGIMPDGEDLSFQADTSTRLEMVRGRLWAKQPCNPKHWFFFCWENRSRRQREKLNWAVNLGDALAKVPGDLHDKKLKSCLTEDTYSCKGSPVLLNARIKLEKGRVVVNKLVGQDDGREGGILPRFMLVSDHALSKPRAQAQEIAVEYDVRGPVEIHSRNLIDSVSREPIRIEGKRGRTVEVRLGNHPLCESVQCLEFESDFLFNFNLLNNPLFADITKLPRPQGAQPLPGPGFNGQCSPATYGGGGGL